jgi:UDP-glucose 4-epimerase
MGAIRRDMGRIETVLVTGGAGFIGSHLTERLLREGFRVRVLDNLVQGRREWVPSEAEFVEGDIVDKAVCHSACRGVVGVFHAAAMSKVAPSLDILEFCTEQNVIGTQNILIAARDAGVRKVVYSGSCSYYGRQPVPHLESLLPQCLNPYSLSKYVGEQYCELFTKLYGLPTITLRYSNVYGPRQPSLGAYGLVLGIFLEQQKKGLPLTIHGTGDQRRDFVHVRDVADANLLAFLSPVQGTACNIGSGANYSIQQLADMISSNQIHEPPRRGDAHDTLADVAKARDLLGWECRIAFEPGLRELMNSPSITTD